MHVHLFVLPSIDVDDIVGALGFWPSQEAGGVHSGGRGIHVIALFIISIVVGYKCKQWTVYHGFLRDF